MKKTKTHAPVMGPQHRRRLLRELGRTAGRKLVVPPEEKFHQEVRRSAAKMFRFPPLIPLSALENSLLRESAKNISRHAITNQMQTAQKIVKGNLKLLRSSEEIPLSPRETAETFSKGKRYDDDMFAEKFEGGGKSISGLGFYGSRGLDGYQYEGYFGVLEEATKLHEKMGRPIRVLDVGSFTGKMLFELKQKMGKSVETHALSPDDVPKWPVDHYHLLMAERMPATFRKKFDLIIAHRALEYTTFPHLALANIVECLSPGGKAIVEFKTNRSKLFNLNQQRLKELIKL